MTLDDLAGLVVQQKITDDDTQRIAARVCEYVWQ